MRLATLNVKIIEPSVLQSIDDVLRSKPDVEVIDVSDSIHISGAPTSPSAFQLVLYIIAPCSGLYTPDELNSFMQNGFKLSAFVKDLKPSQINGYHQHSFYESGGTGHTGPKSLVFGNVTLQEKVGKRIVTYVPEDRQLKAMYRQLKAMHRHAFGPDGTLSVEEDMYRLIRIHPFPNIEYAREVVPLNPFNIRPGRDAKAAEASEKGIGFLQVPYEVLKSYIPKQTTNAA